MTTLAFIDSLPALERVREKFPAAAGGLSERSFRRLLVAAQ